MIKARPDQSQRKRINTDLCLFDELVELSEQLRNLGVSGHDLTCEDVEHQTAALSYNIQNLI